MYLDLSCPIELLEYELSRDDHDKVRAYLSLNNLTNSYIDTIEGDITWINTASNQRKSRPFIADQLNVPSVGNFRIQISADHTPHVDHLEISFRHITFMDDLPEWHYNEANLIRIQEPVIPTGAELNKLVALAGIDARNYSSWNFVYWICVCGRPNDIEQAHCVRCHRNQHEVIHTFDEEAVKIADTSGIISVAHNVEIPSFLHREQPEPARPFVEPESIPFDPEDFMELAMESIKRRKSLIRRTVFMLSFVIVALAMLYAFEWLGTKQQQAKDIRPPEKIEVLEEEERLASPQLTANI